MGINASLLEPCFSIAACTMAVISFSAGGAIMFPPVSGFFQAHLTRIHDLLSFEQACREFTLGMFDAQLHKAGYESTIIALKLQT
jgi:hypothetical protein